MKSPGFLRVSLALNVALGLIYLLPHHVRRAPPASPTVNSGPISRKRPDDTVAGASEERKPATLHWSQVACDDLKQYRDNLRKLDCPKLTVREILLAEINERFGPRRQALLASFQKEFWQPEVILELADRKSAPRGEWLQPLLELAVQRQRLIDEVLGPDRATAAGNRQSRRELFRQAHNWLPQGKSDALFAAEQEHEQLLAQWNRTLSRRADGILTDQDNARRQMIDRSFEETIQRILSPEEMKENRLRESSEAQWAENIPGFEPTEEEWRAVTARQLALQASASSANEDDLTPEDREAREASLEKQRQQVIRDILGPDRFGQYQLANDGAYQAVHGVTERYGLPDDVAVEALDVQRSAEDQAALIRADATLTDDQRRTALSAIASETERTLGQALGAQVWCTYKEYDGDWLNQLNRIEKSP